MGTGKRLGRRLLGQGPDRRPARWRRGPAAPMAGIPGRRVRGSGRSPSPGPVADPHALVLAFKDPRWTVIGADRRTEWSYGAALRQAVADLRERAAAPPQAPRPLGHPAPGRRTVRGGPLTLPVVALIVVLAAAVTGVGSWYAVRSAPAAHVSAVPTPTSSPDSSSPDSSSPTGPATVAGSRRPRRHRRPPARHRSPRRPPSTPRRTRSSRSSARTSRRSTAGTTPRT